MLPLEDGNKPNIVEAIVDPSMLELASGLPTPT
jgi:hypothetical protein